MFTEDQEKLLAAPLKPGVIKQRDGFGGGGKLSYIETHHAIREANRIFGFGNWSRITQEMVMLGEPIKNEKGKWTVAYRAKVKITVGMIERDGCGFGNSTGNNQFDIHELAIKEAESDATKRALATFGDQFGLALYDKQQAHVEKPHLIVDGVRVKQEFATWDDACKYLVAIMQKRNHSSSRLKILGENAALDDALKAMGAPGEARIQRLLEIVKEGKPEETQQADPAELLAAG